MILQADCLEVETKTEPTDPDTECDPTTESESEPGTETDSETDSQPDSEPFVYEPHTPKPKKFSDDLLFNCWTIFQFAFAFAMVCIVLNGISRRKEANLPNIVEKIETVKKMEKVVTVNKSIYANLSIANGAVTQQFWNTFFERRFEGVRETETISQAILIAQAMEKFNSMTKQQQLRLNKWMPAPHKFQGVDEFLTSIGKRYSTTREFMYISQPFFYVSTSDGGPTCTRVMHNYNGTRISEKFENPCDTCIPTHLTIKDGELQMQEMYSDGEEVKHFTRVYYIPVKNLLDIL